MSRAREIAKAFFEGRFKSAEIDSRKVRSGSVFFALPGKHAHGNEFASAALKKRASLVVFEGRAGAPKDSRVVCVRDTAAMMRDIAAETRKLTSAGVVTVTGSVGKTTVKDMLSLCLGPAKKVLATKGNFNNHLGLPLSMMNLRKTHEYAVFEIGTSSPGEISFLAELAKPRVGVLTHIGTAHLEGFGTVEKIAEEKASMFASLLPPAIAVFPDILRRYEAVMRESENCRRIVLQPGEPRDLEEKGGQFHWSLDGVDFQLRTVALHNVQNARLAVEATRALGVPLSKIAAGLAKWSPQPHRMNLLNWRKRMILDDCYNANPVSVRGAAKTALRLRRRPGQKVFAVLGDMAELGPKTRSMHRSVGTSLAKGGVDVLVGLGELVSSTLRAFEREGGHACRLFERSDEVADFLKSMTRPHDIILLKGSRAMKLEQVVNRLIQP